MARMATPEATISAISAVTRQSARTRRSSRFQKIESSLPARLAFGAGGGTGGVEGCPAESTSLKLRPREGPRSLVDGRTSLAACSDAGTIRRFHAPWRQYFSVTKVWSPMGGRT
jgi:hypothetical protein